MANLRRPNSDHGLSTPASDEGISADILALTVSDSPDKVNPTTQDMGRRPLTFKKGIEGEMQRNGLDRQRLPTHNNIMNGDLEMGLSHQRSHPESRSTSVEPTSKYSLNGLSEAEAAAGGQSPAAIPVSELVAAHENGKLAALVDQYVSIDSNRLADMRKKNRSKTLQSEPAMPSFNDVDNGEAMPSFGQRSTTDTEQDDTFRAARLSAKTFHRSQTSNLNGSERSKSPLPSLAPLSIHKVASGSTKVSAMDRRKMMLKQMSPKDSGEDNPCSPTSHVYHSERQKPKLHRQHSVLSVSVADIVGDAANLVANKISHLFARGAAAEQSNRNRRLIFEAAASHRANYAPKSWFFTIVRLHGRPPLGSAWWFVMAMAAVHGVLYRFNIIGGELPVAVHGMTGGCLMFLIVMRTNGAFKKWSEGLKAWTSISAACRELMQQAAAYCDDEALTGTINAHAVAFAVSVRCHLRAEQIEETMLQGVMTDEEFRGLMSSNTPPLYCVHYIRHTIAQGLKNKTIAPVAMGLEASLRIMVSAFADCQRIVQPMPYIYVAHLRTFMLAYLLFLPAALLPLLGLHMLAAVAILSYALIGLENTAVQLEDPFGYDSNDLPLDEFIMDIQDYMLEVLDDKCVKDIYRQGSTLGSLEGSLKSEAPRTQELFAMQSEKAPKGKKTHKLTSSDKKGACDGEDGMDGGED
eukprot:gnl/MRDRNA2_/MRDRNA2_156057_c0_seq1.p1 gnl/MRDRNA2_/MRDRNA2_156057_c0~~gnl/MRDRNA2_/MRDRNA2_156057_c0_seq1.p1  ORF type:complete len:730 (+),score=94.95 gnl/MRDRNA2_/MRDRNA2_156057_c0_seq1:116-2191(+)